MPDGGGEPVTHSPVCQHLGPQVGSNLHPRGIIPAPEHGTDELSEPVDTRH